MKLYSMIHTSPGAMGEHAAKRQRLAHQCLNLDGYESAACISGQYVGLYPPVSPLNINNGWMGAHLTACRQDLADRNATGPICIDYENWKLLMDGDPASTHPDAGRYEACAAAVVRPAIGEAVKRGNLAGLYDWPGFVWDGAPMTDKLKEYHSRTRWVAEASTAMFPVFYLPESAGVDDGWTLDAYNRTIAECNRLAPSLPIICLITRGYAVEPWNTMPDDVVTRQVQKLKSLLMSRDGIAIWESIDSTDELPAIQHYVDIVREAAK